MTFTTNHLTNKHILLGVTGCIAAYKSAALIRLLKKAGAEVKVVMTKSAKEFITPLTLQTLAKEKVYDELFDQRLETEIGHISLARWADLVLIAPASANCIAKLKLGLADDLLSTLCLATCAPIVLAPAMNVKMWENQITQENLAKLTARNIGILEPALGEQACGETGPGRMLEPEEILALVNDFFAPKILSGKKILITASATQEPIDPVRFLSNKSSGKMGYALAQAAKALGAKVTLISGPTNLDCPIGVERISITTAQEMYKAVMQKITACDIFISAAAVADYRVAKPAPQKIKKSSAPLTLKLIPNEDILAKVAKLKKRPLMIGFAAETENLIKNATQKLKAKNLDMIAANLVGKNLGFDQEKNELHIISKKAKPLKLPLALKSKIAEQFMTFIAHYAYTHYT